MGFDSVFVSDHLQPWMHEGGHAPASIPWLGALGARTSRILIGTSVLTPTFRYHPTVDRAGLRDARRDVPGARHPRRRHRRSPQRGRLSASRGPTRPSVSSASRRRSVSSSGSGPKSASTYEGTFYTTRNDATIYDKLDQPVPIYIGAAGPAATRLAGRIADGFITTTGKAPTLYTDTLLPALHEGLEKAGRPADGDRHAHGGQGLVPPRPRRGAGEDPVLGAARPERRREDGHRRPDRDAAARRASCRSSAPPRASSSRPTPTSTSSRSRGTSTWASATSCSTTPATTRRSSSACTGPRSCHGCAHGSEREPDRGERLGPDHPGQARGDRQVAPHGAVRGPA